MKQSNRIPNTTSRDELYAALTRSHDFALKVQLAELYPQEAPTHEELEQHYIDQEFIQEVADSLF